MQERDTAVTPGATAASADAERGESASYASFDAAGRLGRQAGEQGAQMLEERKGWMTDEMRSVADALHRSGDQLEAEGSQAGRYAHWAADALDRVAEHLRQNDMKALLRETQAFARREPGLVIGGALALGFALTRFLKSSESKTSSPAEPPQTH